MFIKSKDFGLTWSYPVEVKSDRLWKPTSMINILLTNNADLGEQGTSLAFYNNDIYISWGAYKNNGIYLTYSKDNGNSFETAKMISSSNVATPITQLIVSNKKWFILYHNGHELGKVNCVESNDFGKTWKSTSISKNASMISGAIDSNNKLHIIWNEKYKKSSFTKYLIFEGNYIPYNLNKEINNKNYFIGAYQKILIDRKNTKHVFWIDWQFEGGKLKYSNWK